MFTIDAHLDLSMNAMEWNRDLRQPVMAIRKREAGLTDKPDRAKGTVALPELLARVRDGLYVGRIWYTYPINGLRAGDFTCTVVGDSFTIRDGRLAAPLKAKTLRINDNVTRLLGSGRLSSPGELVAWSHIDADGRGRLERYAKAHGTRPATVLIALLGAYLARATRRRDVVISLPTTARGTRELRTVPAMVASVLPLRFDVPDDARLADVAEVIDGKLLGLLKHGRYRGEDLGRELAEIDPDWRPPTVGVNIMPAAASRYSVGRESQAHMLSSGPVGELEFILVLETAGHPIEIGLRVHADDAPLAQRCAADLDDFLTAILADLDAPLGTFDVAPAPSLAENPEADHVGESSEADHIGVAAGHEDTIAGPLALMPATARRRDAGLAVDADLRE